MSPVPLPVISSLPPLPREIQVEVTGACNLRCHMCLVRYRPALPRIAGSMSFETFRGIVDGLPELRKVTLQGLGEPLLAPDLFAMIEYAAARNIRVGFNTNATLLHRGAAERLVEGRLGWLCVSLDGATAATFESIRDGARFADVERNVRGLVEVMRRRGATWPELSIVFVAMRRNLAELPAMVKLCAEWGVPRLRVQNLSHSFDDTDPAGAYQEIRDFTAGEALWQESEQGPDPAAVAVFSEARKLAEEHRVALRLPALAEPAKAPRPAAAPGCDSPSRGTRSERGSDPVPPPTAAPGYDSPSRGTRSERGSDRVPTAAAAPGCDWPWRSAYVRHDGKVQPCCMVMGADRAIVGDVRADGVGEVWRGPAYRAFREALIEGPPPDVCRGCSMYRGVF